MKSRNKKGFTMIEVIIVVIILAILASIALPRLLAAVAYSESTEALGVISAIRNSMEQCRIQNNDSYVACNSLVAIGVAYTPKYFKTTPVPGDPVFNCGVNGYTLTFTRSADNTSQIVFDSTGPSVDGSAGGVFQNLHQ
ncbi:MAG: prepilin-type N-terminal cleavage/methylation domain-containing protein [Candidatus Omnitrophica bacterium]|nr:prepilin-type N-terminal cleavage/methylation domain-containing protein [Candidatus Omnitrophota bacterium]